MKRIVIPGQRSSKNVAKRSLAPLHRCQRAGMRQPVTSAIHQSSSKLQSCPPYPLPRNYLRDLAVLGLAVQKLLFEYAGGSEPLKNGRCP